MVQKKKKERKKERKEERKVKTMTRTINGITMSGAFFLELFHMK